MAYAGIAYQPATGAWRRLPSITSLDEGNFEGGSDVVWSGSEALLAGLINGAYSPAANHWRRIASGGLGSPAVTVWTGRQVLMWGGGCCGDDVAAGAAYTPKTDRWEQLPAGQARRAGRPRRLRTGRPTTTGMRLRRSQQPWRTTRVWLLR